jgi:hypothetical protein
VAPVVSTSSINTFEGAEAGGWGLGGRPALLPVRRACGPGGTRDGADDWRPTRADGHGEACAWSYPRSASADARAG